MSDFSALGIDLDRHTGAVITGWAHVEQCLGDVFSTYFGERIMREWYGSLVPALLGENLTVDTIVRFFAAVTSAIEQWEPRFRITKIEPQSVDRTGRFIVVIEGQYRPRALIGDFTVAGVKRVTASGAAGQGLKLS